MNPRINVGKGVTGCVRYVLGEGRDPKTGELLPDPLDGSSRVAWIGGTGFGFNIKTEAHAELARRIMEWEAQNQKGQSQQDCMHLSLSWRPGEQPTCEQMEEAARDALKKLGMGNAKALFVCHSDESYPHVHIVASNINPATGYRYDLERSQRKLSAWALDYEREHGGVISTRRETANELRDAIKERDAGRVLEALTRQRSTFTPAQLENALAKEIRGKIERAQFADKILDHAESVHLSDRPGGPTTRYTTRAVLEAEQYVMRAAEGLAARTGFQIDDKQRAQTIDTEKFVGITREQARAFRHATGAENLVLIDGQAGTGKSYTLAAVREAYEAAGHCVIGLAPTNAVAQDMKNDGFARAATLHSELFALNNGRRNWDSKTVVIVDEAAMLDTKLMAMLTAHAHDAGAKLILVGDDRQLSSIDRGGMFGALKDRYGAAELTEVKRQHKIDERRAAEMMAEGNFHDALNIYQDKGAIHWTRTQGQARAELVEQWTKDSAEKPDKTRFVFAYTNDSVAELNAALRDVRKQRGELGQDHDIDTAHGRHAFAIGDRIQFTGTDKKAGIHNGNAGTIEAIDGSHIAVKLDGKQPKTINFDAANFDQFRHGYAGTVYKGQGRTLDETFLLHSEHWRSAASYVALTRHRDKTELFVARNTAADIKQLARQMGRVDDRRAASMFHHRQEIGPVRPLSAREVLERFAGDSFRQQPAENENQRRGPRVIEQTAAEMRGARKARPLDRQHRQQRQQQDTGKMDNELDEEEQRRRRNAGVGMIIDIEPKQKAANDHPQWNRTEDGTWEMTVAGECVAALIPNPDQADYPNWWLSNGVGTKDLPEHGWDNVDFGSLEQGKETLEKWWDHAQRGEVYAPERPERPQVTREAIERDPWNAVALDLPIKIGETDPALLLQVAETARDLRFALADRAEQAVTPGQQELWHDHAERAEARQKLAETLYLAHARGEPMSAASIDYDPWAAVYQPIPANADVALLQKAHDAAMQCADAVAGEPGPTIHAYEPTLFGKDQDLTREVNFQNAVQRIDELDTRLRAVERQQQPLFTASWDSLDPEKNPDLRQDNAPEPLSKEVDRLEQPFAEKEGRPFSPSEQQPGRYDDLRDRTEATAEPVPFFEPAEAGSILPEKGPTWDTLTPDYFANGKTLRLYRGEEEGGKSMSAGSSATGGWFTTDPDKAGLYGKVSYFDVTLKDLKDFVQGHGGNDEFVTFAPEIINRPRIELESVANEAERSADIDQQPEPPNRLEQPFAEREGRPFSPSEQQPDHYGTIRTEATIEAREPMTIEAIERDPWNAVALDLPADADHELLFLVASTSRELRAIFAERGNEAASPDQQQLWFDLAEQAKGRQKDAETQILSFDAAREPTTREVSDEPDVVLQAMRAGREGKKPEAREPMTIEAIERDPWNAVNLDIPADAEPRLLFLIATTARDLSFSLGDRAGETFSVPDIDAAEKRQAELWRGLADQAEARQKDAETLILGLSADTPLSKEAIDYDPWRAVYSPIPADADVALLQKAHGMAMQCAGAVAGEPGPALHAFEPDLFGADQPREVNFQNAVLRIDELDTRLRAAAPPQEQPEPDRQQPLTLDDIAERVQRIMDDPTREADELDPVILQALQERRAADIDAVQTAAAKEELLARTNGDDERQDRSASTDPAAEATKEATSSEDQSDDDEVQYSEWTGRPIGADHSAGLSHGGGRSQGGGHSR